MFVIFFCLIFGSFIFDFKGDVVGGRLSASNRYRGSRESLQSGMTYSARKGSSSTLHNGTYSIIYHFLFQIVPIFFYLLSDVFVLYMI